MSLMSIKEYCKPITNYINTHHTTTCARIGGIICALVAIELVGRTLHNGFQVLTYAPICQTKKFGEIVGRNFFGAVLAAACATNVIPRLAALGGFPFVAYVFAFGPQKDSLLCTKAIHGGCRMVWEVVVRPILDFLQPVFTLIGNFFSFCLDTGRAILTPIFRVIVPETAEQLAATVVLLAIAVYLLYKRRKASDPAT